MPFMVHAQTDKPFELPEEGPHPAVCVDVIDLGIVDNPYQPGKQQHRCRIVWALDELREDGKSHLVSGMYTVSLANSPGKESNLVKLLRSLGVKFGDSFDLESLIGMGAMIQVVHNLAKDGKRTFANLGGCMPLPKGTKAPRAKYTPKLKPLGLESDGLEAVALISPTQLKMLRGKARAAGVDEERLHAIIGMYNYKSTKDILGKDFDAILGDIQEIADSLRSDGAPD